MHPLCYYNKDSLTIQKRLAGTRSRTIHCAIKGVWGCFPNKQNGRSLLCRDRPFSACVYHYALLASYARSKMTGKQFSQSGRPHALLASYVRGKITGRQENEVLCVWCHTCPACQDCAKAKDWQAGKQVFLHGVYHHALLARIVRKQNNWRAGKRSFLHVACLMPCLPVCLSPRRTALLDICFEHQIQLRPCKIAHVLLS